MITVPSRKAVRGAVALAVLVVAAAPAGVALAAGSDDDAQALIVQTFDARATASPGAFSVDIPEVLIGQKIIGGVLQSDVTATSDPRGFALAGLLPVPKLSSVPLLIPMKVPVLDIPIPVQIQNALKAIHYDALPSQCQAAFPALNVGDDNRTCGGPSTPQDAAFGLTASGANAQVQSFGEPVISGGQPAQVARTIADSRVTTAALPGLQTDFKVTDAYAEAGLNSDGVPTGEADVRSSAVSFVGGLLTIDGIRSHSKVSFDGTKKGTAAATSFSFGQAAVAGIPVEITPQGITVATSAVPVPEIKSLADQLATILSMSGLTVKLLSAPPIQVSDSQVIATSAGIVVDVLEKLPGATATLSFTIGQTRAQVGASPALDTASTGTDTGTAGGGAAGGAAGGGGLSPDSGGSAGVGSADSPPLSSGGLGVDPGLAGGLGGGVSSQAPQVAGGGSGDGLSSSVGDQEVLSAGFRRASLLSPNRLKTLYPLFALLVVGSFVASRGRRLTVWPGRRT